MHLGEALAQSYSATYRTVQWTLGALFPPQIRALQLKVTNRTANSQTEIEEGTSAAARLSQKKSPITADRTELKDKTKTTPGHPETSVEA